MTQNVKNQEAGSSQAQIHQFHKDNRQADIPVQTCFRGSKP